MVARRHGAARAGPVFQEEKEEGQGQEVRQEEEEVKQRLRTFYVIFATLWTVVTYFVFSKELLSYLMLGENMGG